MRRRFPPKIARCQKGSAAAEMAMVTPLLIILMFGAFELGNYFLSEHVVVKAVRDGARYASRMGFSNFTCSSASTGTAVSDPVLTNTRNLVRTGQPSVGGTERLAGWTDETTISVTYDCIDASTATPAYTGIYRGMTYVPVVQVAVEDLDYTTLFSNIGFSSATLELNAESQVPVMGI